MKHYEHVILGGVTHLLAPAEGKHPKTLCDRFVVGAYKATSGKRLRVHAARRKVPPKCSGCFHRRILEAEDTEEEAACVA